MEDPLDIYQDVIDISGDDKEITEADNYPQKDELTDREWRDELDDIRSEINRESYAREAWVVRVIQEETDEVVEELEARDEADAEQIARGMEINMSPDFYTEVKNTAEEDAINPDAKLDTFTTPFLEEEDRFRNDVDFNRPASEVEDEEDEEEIIMSLPAVEDFGSNTIQGDDLITDGYPTDQEGFGRASWDDATIEDRKNWLSVNGFNTDDAWSPYYSLDSYIRSNLAKDLHVGGIKAMGSTY